MCIKRIDYHIQVRICVECVFGSHFCVRERERGKKKYTNVQILLLLFVQKLFSWSHYKEID